MSVRGTQEDNKFDYINPLNVSSFFEVYVGGNP